MSTTIFLRVVSIRRKNAEEKSVFQWFFFFCKRAQKYKYSTALTFVGTTKTCAKLL